MTATLTRNGNRNIDFSTLLESTSEPIGFAAGDANVRRYVGNSTLAGVDPEGLESTSLNTLPARLAEIATSEDAKEEAMRIGRAIIATFDLNGRITWNKVLWQLTNPLLEFVDPDQRARGYYCYEWAYAFEDAVTFESSGKFFTVQVEAYGDLESGKVHSFIRITSKETDKSIYVDDGFYHRGKYVHSEKPIGDIYKTPIPLTAELDRGNCNIPRYKSGTYNEEYDRVPGVGSPGW